LPLFHDTNALGVPEWNPMELGSKRKGENFTNYTVIHYYDKYSGSVDLKGSLTG